MHRHPETGGVERAHVRRPPSAQRPLAMSVVTHDEWRAAASGNDASALNPIEDFDADAPKDDVASTHFISTV